MQVQISLICFLSQQVVGRPRVLLTAVELILSRLGRSNLVFGEIRDRGRFVRLELVVSVLIFSGVLDQVGDEVVFHLHHLFGFSELHESSLGCLVVLLMSLSLLRLLVVRVLDVR